MLGWLRAEAALASRQSVRMPAALGLRCSGRNLSATKRPSFGVLGLVDDTHTAAAKFLDDTIVRDGLADHWAEILGLHGGQVNEGGWLAVSRAVIWGKSRGC